MDNKYSSNNRIDHGFKINQSGFSMIELLSIIVLLALLTIYAAKTSFEIVGTSERVDEINRIKAHLKYAQSRAINSAGYWGIDLTDTSIYSMFSWDIPIPASPQYKYFPGEVQKWAPSKFNCGIKKPDSGKFNTFDDFIWFDSWGRAYTTNTYDTSINLITPIASNLTIVSLKNGTPIITIQKNTGYVQCDYQL